MMPRLIEMIRTKIETPWKHSLEEMFTSFSSAGTFVRIAGKVLFQGVVCDTSGSTVWMRLKAFSPGEGFSVLNDDVWEISVEDLDSRDQRWHPGDTLSIYGMGVERGSNCLDMSRDAIVLVVPTWDIHDSITAIHLFSGSFCGWSQALDAIGKKDISQPVGQQYFIDSDPRTMQNWSHQFVQQVHYGPTQPAQCWCPSPHVGICTPVNDCSVCHHIRARTNVVGTASPPCVTWSKAGRSQGLNSSAGFSFVDAAFLILVMQPNVQVFECADEIVNHPHFGLISHLLKLGGFRRIWQQVVEYHHLSHNVRDRWVSAWVRLDMHPKINNAKYCLSMPDLCPWSSDCYDFPLPQDFREGLLLSDELQRLYGNRGSLPPAKKARVAPDAPVASVLRERVIRSEDPLPTICASYGHQHELASHHIASRGLLAFFSETPEGLQWIEPTRIVALLGSTSTTSTETFVRTNTSPGLSSLTIAGLRLMRL